MNILLKQDDYNRIGIFYGIAFIIEELEKRKLIKIINKNKEDWIRFYNEELK